MTKLVDAKGGDFNYNYKNGHNITSDLSVANIKFNFAYDPVENLIVNRDNKVALVVVYRVSFKNQRRNR